MSKTSHLESEDSVQLASIFEERAEHLSREELDRWTAYSERDEEIIGKLMGPGAKLLIGPRGSGKSTLLRTAYFRHLRERQVLAAYVNYAKSLSIEPLFHKQANALQVFRQWVVMKVVLSVATAIKEMGLAVPESLSKIVPKAKKFVRTLETSSTPELPERPIAPSELVELLEEWADELELSRVVLLMDDAAHVFSLEQQREFFEVFRELRSRRVSGKAAVYPGITSYSPNFHVGNEAERVEAWYRTEDPEYLPRMRDIVARRLPDELKKRLVGREEIVDYLALAAFGLPRGFLNMLSQLLEVGENSAVNPTRQRADQAIAEYAESVRGIFRALKGKLPRFRHFVETGAKLDLAMVAALRRFNAIDGSRESKATVIGLREPIGGELERMLNMLEYAGVVRKISAVSRGVKGRFERYSIHYAIIIADTALGLGKSYSSAAVVAALSERDAHAFVRTDGDNLLGVNFQKECTLDLPPCKKCGTIRVSDEQRFCMKCGNELANASVYEELLRRPIDELPLTAKKIEGIKAHTDIRTIQDVILDDEVQQLRTVPYIGKFWATRIRIYAEEFVSV